MALSPDGQRIRKRQRAAAPAEQQTSLKKSPKKKRQRAAAPAEQQTSPKKNRQRAAAPVVHLTNRKPYKKVHICP